MSRKNKKLILKGTYTCPRNPGLESWLRRRARTEGVINSPAKYVKNEYNYECEAEA